jgi:hypothetical protein
MSPILIASVCLFIDVADTNPPDAYPNMASEVENYQSTFTVKNGQKSCFDLSKDYYMQYYLFDKPGEVWYGTKCRYNPKPEDDGKTLHYVGANGSSFCPVS